MSRKPQWEDNFDDWTEDFIRNLKWSDAVKNDQITLVAGNIRNFAHAAKEQLLIAAKEIKRTPTRERGEK